MLSATLQSLESQNRGLDIESKVFVVYSELANIFFKNNT